MVSALCLFVCTAIIYSLVGIAPSPQPVLTTNAFPVVPPTLRYGLAVDTLQLRINTIRAGQTLSDILLAQGLSRQEAFVAAERFNGLLDVRDLRAKHNYTIINDADTEGVDYLVYQPSIYEYVRLDLRGAAGDERVQLPVRSEIAVAAGKIESSLWNAMTGAGLSFALTDRMEDALQWSVDFYHVQPNDAFQLVYEKKYVEGEEAAPGAVKAARYSTSGEDIYAFWYCSPDSTHQGYFGLNGEPMKAPFLKSPVRFSRMSSAFNMRRFHPIQKRIKPHLGTDYAADYGTPILATADGIIIEQSRRGGNGNYVKLRHNKQYSTQYLHMQRFVKGNRVGTRVRQGETIGFVGATGLATGPHVCYRFWKDGRQIDHTKLRFPPAKTMPEHLMPSFELLRDQYLSQLNKVGQPVQNTDDQITKGRRLQAAMLAAKLEEAK